jgi:hypothetical protein
LATFVFVIKKGVADYALLSFLCSLSLFKQFHQVYLVVKLCCQKPFAFMKMNGVCSLSQVSFGGK